MDNLPIVKTIIRKDDIEIQNSYLIRKTNEMFIMLKALMNKKKYKEYGYNRKMSSYIAEWKVHNFLYRLGIKRARTKDVNLNREFPKTFSQQFQKLVYNFVSIFYKRFDKMK